MRTLNKRSNNKVYLFLLCIHIKRREGKSYGKKKQNKKGIKKESIEN